MEFFKTNTQIQFMRSRVAAAVFSMLIFAGSIWALCAYGLNLSLDFTGGTQIEMSFKQPVEVAQVRTLLESKGFPQAEVQAYTTKDVSIRIGPHRDMTQQALKARIQSLLPKGIFESFNYIGPKVGQALMTNGVLAIIVSLIITMIYIALRFDYRFAISAAIAMIHDPILILGIFSFFHIEFSLVVLAAVLTVIGYSLNDTIVVYDRVRENFRKVRKRNPAQIMDMSINQTLSRTIMTSGLTLLVVIVLYGWGGEAIHGFSLALIIGIVIGTYSSIYIAGSFALSFGLTRKALVPEKRVVDDLP